MADPQLFAHAIASAFTAMAFDDFSDDINLMTVTPTGRADPTGAACRLILITDEGSGSIELEFADGSSVTIPGLVAGQELRVQAAKILKDETDITSCVVFW